MTKIKMDIDDKLADIEVLTERAKVLVADVCSSYFGWDLTKPDQAWKAEAEFYKIADVKINIASDILFDLMGQVEALREFFNEEDKGEAT